MPIRVADIVRSAGEVLQDEDHIRWTVPELIGWAYDGARELIVHKPSARTSLVALPLAAGAKQDLPERGVQVLDVTRNMGADGATPGRAIRRVDRRLMDAQHPDWPTDKPKSLIRHYMVDERSPKTFYVWPPAVAGTQVEALFSELPPPIADESDDLDLGAEYQAILLDYVVFRALSKDSEYANGTVAALHYQAFRDAIDDSTNKVATNSPKANSV